MNLHGWTDFGDDGPDYSEMIGVCKICGQSCDRKAKLCHTCAIHLWRPFKRRFLRRCAELRAQGRDLDRPVRARRLVKVQ